MKPRETNWRIADTSESSFPDVRIHTHTQTHKHTYTRTLFSDRHKKIHFGKCISYFCFVFNWASVYTFFGDNSSFWLSAWPFTQSTIYMLYFHAKKEFQDIFQHIFFVWCKQLQVLTVLMEKDHVSSHSQGSDHHCCMPPPKCQLFTNNSGAVFGSTAIHFWHIQWIKKKMALHLNWKHETFLTSQQQYCISDGPADKPAMGAFHAFPNQTKLKAIICVLPQGGHLTENNRWLLRSNLVFLYETVLSILLPLLEL